MQQQRSCLSMLQLARLRATILLMLLAHLPLGALSVRLHKRRGNIVQKLGGKENKVDGPAIPPPLQCNMPTMASRAGEAYRDLYSDTYSWLPPFRWMPPDAFQTMFQEYFTWALDQIPTGGGYKDVNASVNQVISQMAERFSGGRIAAADVDAHFSDPLNSQDGTHPKGVTALDFRAHTSDHQVWFDVTCLIMDIVLKIEGYTKCRVHLEGGLRAGWIEEWTYVYDEGGRQHCMTGYPVEGIAGEPMIQVVKDFFPSVDVASAILLLPEREKGLPGAQAKGTKGKVLECKVINGEPMVQVKFEKNFGTRWLKVWELRHSPLAIHSSIRIPAARVTEILTGVWRPHCIAQGIPNGRDAKSQFPGEETHEESPGVPFFHVSFLDNSWLGPMNHLAARVASASGSDVIRAELCLAAISGMRDFSRVSGVARFTAQSIVKTIKPTLKSIPRIGKHLFPDVVDGTKKNYEKECAKAGHCIPAHGTGATCSYCGGFSCDGTHCNTMRLYVADRGMALALQNSVNEYLALYNEDGVPYTSAPNMGQIQAEVAAGLTTERWIGYMIGVANRSGHKFQSWSSEPFWGDCSYAGWVRTGENEWLPEWDPSGVRLLRPLSPARGCDELEGRKGKTAPTRGEEFFPRGTKGVLNAWIGNPAYLYSEGHGVDITKYLVGNEGHWDRYWTEKGIGFLQSLQGSGQTQHRWNRSRLGEMPTRVHDPAFAKHVVFAKKALTEIAGADAVDEMMARFIGEDHFLAEKDAYMSFTVDVATATITLQSYQYDNGWPGMKSKIREKSSRPIQLPAYFQRGDSASLAKAHLIVEWRPDGLTPVSRPGKYNARKCFCGGTSKNTYGMSGVTP